MRMGSWPGQVPLMPPLRYRFKNVREYEQREPSRNVNSVDGGSSKQDVKCTWCECTKQCYLYDPRQYGHDSEYMRFCGWMCFDQWLDYREDVSAAIDAWLLFGIKPDYIPEWYMPADVLASLLEAHEHLNLEETA